MDDDKYPSLTSNLDQWAAYHSRLSHTTMGDLEEKGGSVRVLNKGMALKDHHPHDQDNPLPMNWIYNP